MQLPLFPLSSVVLPGGVMKLRLFERRYIDMVKHCFRTDTGFGVCLIRDGREAGVPSEPYPLGTRVAIVDFDQGEDGLLHISVRGEEEFEIHRHWIDDNQLVNGDVTPLPARAPTAMTPAFETLANKLELILRYVEPDISYAEQRLDDADWVCHRLLELLPLAAPAKYELLQLHDNHARLESLATLQIEIAER